MESDAPALPFLPRRLMPATEPTDDPHHGGVQHAFVPSRLFASSVFRAPYTRSPFKHHMRILDPSYRIESNYNQHVRFSTATASSNDNKRLASMRFSSEKTVLHS